MQDNQIQQLLDEAAASLGIVGAQCAIADGSGVREFATGMRNSELRLPVTPQTVFQIGSTTKVFNAALVMAMVDERLLDLDTPVINYIPSFRLASLEAQQTITLRHLLSMTAGIDNGTYHDYGRGDDALGRYVEALAGVTHLFGAGSAYGYSNASTNVAGHAASLIGKDAWEKLLAKYVLQPLGLQNSALFAEDLLHHPVAMGYQREDKTAPAERVPGWALPRSMGPAGGSLCLSAGDLARFGKMFVDGGRSRSTGTQVLSGASVMAMQTPEVVLRSRLMADEWCVGPYRKEWDGVKLFGHSGTNVGGSSTLLWCPERDFAIATVVNVANQGYPLAQAMFAAVLPALFGITPPALPDLKTQATAVADPMRYVGRYEALGITLRVEDRDGVLVIVEDNDVARIYDMAPVIESELVPLGEDRFLPKNPIFSGNRIWDIAFWDADKTGRPTHCLNGLFAYRRT
ncbi:MAG: serine hydrolase domain-containing protein [Sphingobium sp.]